MKYVPAFQVLSFNIIKKPIISGLWYAFLAYTLFTSSNTLAIVIGAAFLFLSLTKIRFLLAILSPIPCIAEMIISQNVFTPTISTIILSVGIVWILIYLIAMFVWYRLAKGVYEILPVSNKMVIK